MVSLFYLHYYVSVSFCMHLNLTPINNFSTATERNLAADLQLVSALSWLRSPHLSQHTPFVREETIILVKTGHLPFA